MVHPEKGSSPKRRLGRGLSSLIVGSTTDATPAGDYQPSDHLAATTKVPVATAPPAGAQEIPIDEIAPNPLQPRRDFRDDEMSQLADSIARQGIIQPLLVMRASGPPSDRPYTLIAGERRLRAAAKAGRTTVPCVIRAASRQELIEWALVENIHRADLNPIERARAYREYIDRFALTQAEAGERLCQPRATVANYLRIIDLPDSVQDLLVQGSLSFGHAKVLSGLAGDPERQMELARQAVSEPLSVRQLEELIASPDGGRPSVSEARTKRTPTRPAYVRDLEDQLTRAVGTRVVIRPGRAKNTGRIVIDYYSLDDFDRIVGGLGATLES